jgi:hypothetical protein
MSNLLFYILFLGALYLIIRTLKTVILQRKHLTEEELDRFVKRKMDRDSDEFTKFVGHLSRCETCQNRLNEMQDKV